MASSRPLPPMGLCSATQPVLTKGSSEEYVAFYNFRTPLLNARSYSLRTLILPEGVQRDVRMDSLFPILNTPDSMMPSASCTVEMLQTRGSANMVKQVLQITRYVFRVVSNKTSPPLESWVTLAPLPNQARVGIMELLRGDKEEFEFIYGQEILLGGFSLGGVLGVHELRGNDSLGRPLGEKLLVYTYLLLVDPADLLLGMRVDWRS